MGVKNYNNKQNPKNVKEMVTAFLLMIYYAAPSKS